ncbi:MAG: hypothetical protein K6B68_17760 [Eubacterium sp.]|nr:hypothetical protein [Eubacterium sp.]
MSRKECKISQLCFGDRIYYSIDGDYGGYVVRSSDDSDVIIVEQDNGQVTAYDNDTVIYVEK